MKIRQWIAVILTAFLLPVPYGFGEETKDSAELVSEGSDAAAEIVSSEVPEKGDAGETVAETLSGLQEESLIFVFEMTGQEDKTGIETEEMTEAAEAEASVWVEATAIPEKADTANEEPAEMTELEASEIDEGINESEEPETFMPGEKPSETAEAETFDPDEASAASE